jgi:ABC-type molybdate transport system substrate-binding protein
VIDSSAADQTLVVVVQETCAYCEQSVPFYQKVLAQRGKARVVVAAPTEITGYLAKHELRPDATVQLANNALAIPWPSHSVCRPLPQATSNAVPRAGSRPAC